MWVLTATPGEAARGKLLQERRTIQLLYNADTAGACIRPIDGRTVFG